MTKSITTLFLVVFPLLLSFNLGGHLKFAEGLEALNSWCIARYTATDGELLSNIVYACNAIGDCKMIQEGNSCFNPYSLLSHASAAMNQYYALNGKNPWNCYFSGTGLIVITDPSYGSCEFV